MLSFIVIFWGFFVLNTELVIRWNKPADGDDGATWQFGQVRSITQYVGLHSDSLKILPMFLTLLPLINMINAFKRFGIKPTAQVYQQTKVAVIYDVGFEARQHV